MKVRLAQRANRPRRGLTLFEVLLALAIFVGAFAAIGQLINSGVRGALQSRMRLQAAQLCQAKMGEVVCGALPLQSAQAVFPEDAAWSWSMVVSPAPVPGLMLVQVTVQRVSKNQQATVKFDITRYVRDPQLYLAAEEEANAQQQAEAEAAQ
jgi:general secretion pathway protein I